VNDELWRAFDAAGKKLKAATPTARGGQGNEAAYGAAYAALVRAGEAMPLKAKYRKG
jgi:hypothetical protein